MITKEYLRHCLEAGDTHLQLADHIKTVRLLDVGDTGAIIETVDTKNRRNIKIAPLCTIEYAYTKNGKQQPALHYEKETNEAAQRSLSEF